MKLTAPLSLKRPIMWPWLLKCTLAGRLMCCFELTGLWENDIDMHCVNKSRCVANKTPISHLYAVFSKSYRARSRFFKQFRCCKRTQFSFKCNLHQSSKSIRAQPLYNCFVFKSYPLFSTSLSRDFSIKCFLWSL